MVDKFNREVEVSEKFNKAFYLLNSYKLEPDNTNYLSLFSLNPKEWENPKFGYQAKKISHYKEALHLLLELNEQYPGKKVSFLISTAYTRLGIFEKAQLFIEKSLFIDKNFYPSIFRTAIIHTGNKEYEKAIEVYSSLLLTHPEDFRLY